MQYTENWWSYIILGTNGLLGTVLGPYYKFIWPWTSNDSKQRRAGRAISLWEALLPQQQTGK